MDLILDRSYFKNVQRDKYSFQKASRFPHLDSQRVLSRRRTIDANSSSRPRISSFLKQDSNEDEKRNNRPSPPRMVIPQKNPYLMNSDVSLRKPHSKHIDPDRFRAPQARHTENSTLQLRRKAPSTLIISKHQEDHFIQPSLTPDPAHYHPNDYVHSRRKRSSQFAFGTTKRFDYDTREINRMVGPNSYQLTLNRKDSRKAVIGHAVRKTYVAQEMERSVSPGPKYYLY